MHRSITCLNGRFLRSTRALVPITDRGFRFGDGLFETLRLHRGVPYQWELHLARLNAGLTALRIDMPPVDWAAYTRKLLRKNRATDGSLRITISRGTGSAGYLPTSNHPTWAIEYIPVRPLPAAPCALWLSSHTRTPLSSLPVNSKLAQGLGSTLALLEAQDHECDEALQLTTSGLIASAASANIFWVKNKTLFTPALSTGCLNGTIRAAILRLAPVPVHEIDADLSALETSDAAFLTNSRVGVWPIKTLAPTGLSLNDASPLIAQIQDLISSDKDNYSNEYSANWRSNS